MLHMAMFTHPKDLPNFPPSITVIALGQKIKALFDNKTLTHLSLSRDGSVVCY
jgi:hypothetical protein